MLWCRPLDIEESVHVCKHFEDWAVLWQVAVSAGDDGEGWSSDMGCVSLDEVPLHGFGEGRCEQPIAKHDCMDLGHVGDVFVDLAAL